MDYVIAESKEAAKRACRNYRFIPVHELRPAMNEEIIPFNIAEPIAEEGTLHWLVEIGRNAAMTIYLRKWVRKRTGKYSRCYTNHACSLLPLMVGRHT